MPDFWLAILLIIVFAANLQWLPAIGYVPCREFWPWFRHLILPAMHRFTVSAIIAQMGWLIPAGGLEPTSLLPASKDDELDDHVRPCAAERADPGDHGDWRPTFALLISGAVVNVFAIKGWAGC
jgi:peptide/nickel transport system permease protein